MATSFASSSTSTSKSHANTNNYVFDVFISHRGPDTKKGLASHIYQGLTPHGLRVFLDCQEMQGGENLAAQIKGAIQTASVHLAIFSQNYASSRWCLDELVQMVETKKPIIPVFYRVNPSELRHPGALNTIEKKETSDPQTNEEIPRHHSNTIAKWREALSDVAEISGFELSACNDDEGLLVNKVIQRVLQIVPKTPPLNVAIYPTGLHDKVKEVQKIVSSQHQSGNLARAVGIVGLGGIGKTTLAKQFFNSERSNYQRICFLSDVREKAAKNSLKSLKVQLFKDLCSGNEDLPSSLTALVVIDDVDHIDQLHALYFPVKHTSSLVLVTSRNKDVLTSADIVESSIYMMKGLNRQLSKELFCWHAFGKSYPVIEFEQLAEKFLDACHGLPLSLKVIGALLCGKRDSTFWEQQLLKISRILPTDIQSRLQISYDGLDEEEKHIFLDIACFFIGMDTHTAIRIWDGSGWQGWLGLRNLENRCLVEVDSRKRIRMHDHLRDLGRVLAKKSEYPRRLWRITDLDDLSNHAFVRGIHMVHGNDAEESFEDLADSNMSRLQLLRGEGDFVQRVLNVGRLRRLIYLHWDNCPHSLPPSISLKNLRVLYIQGKNLEKLWEDESDQAPLELREMVIHAATLQTLPDSIGNLRNLQSLDMNWCSGLQTLPDSFGNMTNLQSLDMNWCCGLQTLPDSFGNMTNLQSLRMTRCSGLQTLPDSFGNMTNLQSLDMTYCSGLQTLPDSFGNMTTLQSLDMKWCSGLQMLPDSFGNMTNLQSLNLRGCWALQMPPIVEHLSSLERLNVSECPKLQWGAGVVEQLHQRLNTGFIEEQEFDQEFKW